MPHPVAVGEQVTKRLARRRRTVPDEVEAALAGRGVSTASQTAWALLALLAAADGGPPGQSADAGIRWLAEHQRPDGTWDEPEYTGTGFPGDFYLNYHLYRLVFPVSALGRYLSSPAPGTP